MAESFKQRVAEKIVTTWVRMKHEDHVVHVNKILDESESIMVCFPDGFEDGMAASKVLPILRDRFPRGKITVFVTRINLEKVRKSPYVDNFIALTEKDFGYALLPSKDLVNRIKSMDFGVAIDLNPRFHFPTALLCYRSGAQLRIGLRDRDVAPFFNVEIISMGDESARNDPLVTLIRVLQTV